MSYQTAEQYPITEDHTPTPSDDTTAEIPRLVSPKRNKPVYRADAERLEKYMILHGGRLDINEETTKELKDEWQISPSRVAACICNLRKLYGRTIISERDGRRVTAYVMHPTAPTTQDEGGVPDPVEAVQVNADPNGGVPTGEVRETPSVDADPNGGVTTGWLSE